MNQIQVKHSDENFRTALFIFIAVLFIINVYSLFTGNFLALIAIALQSSILIAVYKKHRVQIVLIKIWATFVFLSGLAGLVEIVSKLLSNYLKDNVALNDGLQTTSILYAGFAISVGYYCFSEVSNKTTLVDSQDLSPKDTAAAG